MILQLLILFIVGIIFIMIGLFLKTLKVLRRIMFVIGSFFLALPLLICLYLFYILFSA